MLSKVFPLSPFYTFASSAKGTCVHLTSVHLMAGKGIATGAERETSLSTVFVIGAWRDAHPETTITIEKGSRKQSHAQRTFETGREYRYT